MLLFFHLHENTEFSLACNPKDDSNHFLDLDYQHKGVCKSFSFDKRILYRINELTKNNIKITMSIIITLIHCFSTFLHRCSSKGKFESVKLQFANHNVFFIIFINDTEADIFVHMNGIIYLLN